MPFPLKHVYYEFKFISAYLIHCIWFFFPFSRQACSRRPAIPTSHYQEEDPIQREQK